MCKECGGSGWQFECDPMDERELYTPTVSCSACGGSGNMEDSILSTGSQPEPEEVKSCEGCKHVGMRNECYLEEMPPCATCVDFSNYKKKGE